MKVLQYVLAFLCALALMAGQVFGEAQVEKHETSIKVGEYNNENSLGYVQDVYNDIRYYKKNNARGGTLSGNGFGKKWEATAVAIQMVSIYSIPWYSSQIALI